MDIETLTLQNGNEYEIHEFNCTRLLAFKNGNIYRWAKGGYWKFVSNTANTAQGYNNIQVGNIKNGTFKMIKRHRIMAYVFLNLDIDNPKLQIDHIDGNKINNHIDNLRIVNHQQNHFNRTTAKGYYFRKAMKKYHAQIKHNNKLIYLGLFNTEEEAHQAYLNAKLIYHII